MCSWILFADDLICGKFQNIYLMATIKTFSCIPFVVSTNHEKRYFLVLLDTLLKPET